MTDVAIEIINKRRAEILAEFERFAAPYRAAIGELDRLLAALQPVEVTTIDVDPDNPNVPPNETVTEVTTETAA